MNLTGNMMLNAHISPITRDIFNSSPRRCLIDNLFFDANKDSVFIDFLMPNGILIQHEVSTTTPLVDIKAEIWEKASEYPLIGLLPPDQTSYHFCCVQVTSGVATQELMEETQCLRDINMFMNILKVVKRNIGQEEETRLNINIGALIGKGLSDFSNLRNPEVNDFRWKMRNESNEIVRERNKLPWASQVQYLHPCGLAPNPELPKYISERVPNGQLHFTLQFPRSQKVEATYRILVSITMLPSELLEYTFRKKLNTVETDLQCRNFASEYILKICGREEYLVCEVPLSQYTSIRNHILNSPLTDNEVITPFQLIPVLKSEINVEIDTIYGKIMESTIRPTRSSISANPSNKKHNTENSWAITENFKLKIGALSNVNVEEEDISQVSMKIGIYHASNPLCQTLYVNPFSVVDGNASVEKELELPIQVCNIPRSSRICIAVYEHTQSKKLKQCGVDEPIAWVNTSVFDYKGYLKGGSMTLFCWSIIEENLCESELPNALGTVVSSPNQDTALAITLSFPKYRASPNIIFPLKETILNTVQRRQPEEEPEVSVSEKEEIQKIANRDPLSELYEQDRRLIWSRRRYCLKAVPLILPKMLQCVEWNNYLDVAEMLVLLEKWPTLSPDRALELLDYAYPEPAVRSYAIDCLSHMSDDDCLLYLLQMVQAIKHENYLYCDLVQFLLERALKNRKIGHFLFWHLRSEMHVPSVSIRFGLILEAYCRGSVEHMKLLQRQMHAFDKFNYLQKVVVEHRGNRDKAINSMQDVLNLQATKLVLCNFVNPIDPSFRISSVRVKKCKTMDSKMVPLWLEFANSDPHGGEILFLFKKGDDIRQDMLTLQMIRIMDKLWKDHGLDFRLNPYSCLSTNSYEGVIQIVKNAQTIANIQKQKGIVAAASTFRRSTLLDWLRKNNTNGLSNAINEFMLSCAGYSVATYILGIADRHNDNIMILPNGQLFHIDFGHILGHFKEKFRIKRESQPFVLTHDFIYVIQEGKEVKTENFKKFNEYCERAFMILRQYGTFIISLFAMMISTGLPELQSEKDLVYLQETLRLDLNDEEARKHFQSKFNEARANCWKTTVNWTFHNMSKSNI